MAYYKMPWLAGSGEEDLQTFGNKIGSGVKGLFTAAPMVAGAAYGFNQMVGNSPLSAIVSRRNGLISTNRSVGANLTEMQAAATANKVKATEQFAAQITNSDHIGNIIRSGAEERKALIAGVLDQLDNNLPANANIRQSLLEMLDMTDEVAAREINAIQTKVNEGIGALSTGGGDYKARLQQSINSYKSVASQLVAPTGSVGSTGVAIEKITRAQASALKISDQAKGLFEMLQSSLTGHKLSISHIDGGFYATGTSGKQTFHIPIQGKSIGTGAGGAPIQEIRMGTGMGTKYVGGQMYIDAPTLFDQHISKGTLPNRQEIARSMRSGQGAFVDYPTMVAREYASLAQKNSGTLRAKDLRYAGSRIRALSTWSANSNLPHMHHQKVLASSTAHILNLEHIPAASRADFGARLAATNNPLFDPAVSPQLINFEEAGMGNRISLKTRVSGFEGSTSPINEIRNLTGSGPIDRALLPITARPRQVVNRANWFVPNGTDSTLGTGRSISMYNQNLGFVAGGRVNGINTAVLMKLGEGGQALGLTEGMSYWGGQNEIVRSNLSRGVTSAAETGTASSALMRELVARRQGGLGALTLGSTVATGPNAGKVIGSVDEFFSIFGASERGAFLGRSGDAMRFVPKQSNMVGFSLSLGAPEMKGGFVHNQLVNSYIDTSFGTGKGFSMADKATYMPQTDRQFVENINKFGNRHLPAWAKSMNLTARNTAISTGEMLGKSVHNLALQMTSSIGLIGKNNMDDVYRAAREGGITTISQGSEVARQAHYAHSTIRFTAQQLSGAKVAPSQLGLAFGGAMYMGQEGKFGLTTESVEQSIREGFRGTRHEGAVNQIIKASKRHEAIGAATMTPGAPASEYKNALGSLTPRGYQMLAHRLQNTLGMTKNATADFLTAVLARKDGMGAHLDAFKSMNKTMETLSNLHDFDSPAFRQMEKEAMVSARRFAEAGAHEGGLKRLMQQHPQGFLVDLAGGGGSIPAMADSFEGSTKVRIFGSDTLDNLRGVEVMRNGEKVRLEARAFERVQEFARDISIAESGGAAQSREVGTAFRRNMAEVWGGTSRALLKGKLGGSGWVEHKGLVLGERATTLPTEQLNRFRSAFNQAGGGMAFVDSQGFFNSIKTYMGAAEREMMSANPALDPRQAANMARRETVGMTRDFFLGMERDFSGQSAKVMGGKHGGVAAISGRYPMLGPGHITPTQLFRYDFGNQDDVFRRFAATDSGARAVTELEKSIGKGQIRSFRDIANNLEGNTRSVNRFFGSFLGALNDFTGAGGGRYFAPEMNVDVAFKGQANKLSMNLGRAAGMFADSDGDMVQIMLGSKKRHAAVLGNQAASNISDIVTAARTELYFNEAKQGLKNVQTAGRGSLGHLDALYQTAMKEVYAKDVGPLNSALDHLRMGLVESAATGTKEEAVLAERAMALLPTTQEVANLKGKKLERATPLASMYERAVKQGIATRGGSTELFDAFIKDVVFRGSNLVNQGAAVDLARTDLSALPSNVRNQVRAGLSSINDGSIDDVLKYMRNVFHKVGTEGYDTMGTVARNTGLALQGNDHWRHLVQQGHSVEGALGHDGGRALRGAIEEVAKDTKSALSSANMKLLGPLAVGVAGSMLVGAAIGDKGYSSTPLIQPGEISDHRVNAAIAAGRLGNDHGPISPESIEPGPHMDMVNRPINTQQAYFARKNAWSVSGQILGADGMSGLNRMLGSLGGQSSVRINDTRMPITPNYIDRVTGD